MSENMIERVAKAVHLAHSEYRLGAITYDDVAKAAIEAMKEPTEFMIVSGLKALVDEIERLDPECETSELVRSGSEVNQCWNGMIEAALKDD